MPDCNLATSRYCHIVKNERTTLELENSAQNGSIISGHAGHTVTFCRPFSSTLLLCKCPLLTASNIKENTNKIDISFVFQAEW